MCLAGAWAARAEMKSICAWCGLVILPGGGDEPADGPVTHGICGSCRSNIDCQEGVTLQSYLDTIPLPILVLDSEFKVAALNRKACEITGSCPHDPEKSLPGDVFECEYARRPGGCGRAVCCSGCAIRKAVLNTFETGEPASGIPATLTLDGEQPPIALTITTMKVGDVVVLRVIGLGD